jgi:hypothetical protein
MSRQQVPRIFQAQTRPTALPPESFEGPSDAVTAESVEDLVQRSQDAILRSENLLRAFEQSLLIPWTEAHCVPVDASDLPGGSLPTVPVRTDWGVDRRA